LFQIFVSGLVLLFLVAPGFGRREGDRVEQLESLLAVAGDHEGEGHHDHTHLQKRNCPKHPPPFPRMPRATAGARKTALWPPR
jgi:hypothetical protein